jgi:hypothetical protein
MALVQMRHSVVTCGGVSVAPLLGAAMFVLMLPGATLAQSRVLQVGTYGGQKGAFTTIQGAVDAAQPGDWVLIAPGDYHESGAADAGVRITKPGIHLRGMDRNGVVVDGTLPGSATCSNVPAAQVIADFGRNGIEVVKADGVSIENLTVCNFLGDNWGDGGNQIWWNGGYDSGVIGIGGYSGAYLTASTTYFSVSNAAYYGIFISNSKGPGIIERSYASNMADSAFYVGACPDCNAVLRLVHAQNSAVGYSGSNSGGHVLIEASEWDLNRVGIQPTSLANDDPPSPQDGACPADPTQSCTLIQFNYVHDNNNPNTPGLGLAGAVPIGTGIEISGGRNDTVRGNKVVNNGAWGILINDYPDLSTPSVPTWCKGGTVGFTPTGKDAEVLAPLLTVIGGPTIPCYFHAFGNRIIDNVFAGNGSFGNPTNGDLGNFALDYPINNCFVDNVDHMSDHPTSAPTNLQGKRVAGTCGAKWSGSVQQLSLLFLNALCDTYGPAFGACSTAAGDFQYPTPTGEAQLLPIPREQEMPDPCQGVPPNSWCPARRS